MNTYQPPKGSQQVFVDTIKHILNELQSVRYSDICLLGDLNMDPTVRKRNDYTDSLIHVLKTFGLNQIIEKPTRITLNTSSLIDVLYIKTARTTTPFIIKTNTSDHYMVGCTCSLNYEKPAGYTITGRTYRNYTYQKAKDYYELHHLQGLYELTNVDLIWERLYRLMKHCADNLCPTRTMTVRRDNPVWITSEIIELINDRDSLFDEGYSQNRPDYIDSAKVLRTEVKRVLRNARADFIKNELEKHGNNTKKFWTELNK